MGVVVSLFHKGVYVDVGQGREVVIAERLFPDHTVVGVVAKGVGLVHDVKGTEEGA